MTRNKNRSATQLSPPNAILSLFGSYHTTCGYCGEQPGTRSAFQSNHSYGADPICRDLQCSVSGEAMEAILNPNV